MTLLLDSETREILVAVLALVGALVAITALILQFFSFKRKGISYSILAVTPLIAVDEGIKNDLSIRFQDKEISDATLIVLKLFNSGNTAIVPEDFYKNVRIDFKDTTQVLTVTTNNASPEDFILKYDVVNSTVQIMPTLFNRKDTVELHIVASNYSGGLDVKGRIAGVDRITYVPTLAVKSALSIGQQLKKAGFMFVFWLFGATMILVGASDFVGQEPAYVRGTFTVILGISMWLSSIIFQIRGFENWVIPMLIFSVWFMSIAAWVTWFLGTPMF